MKRVNIVLALLLVVAMLTGCAGTAVVYYNDCTCPAGTHDGQIQAQPENDPTTEPTDAAPVVPVGALRTGLAILANASGSANASEDTAGQIKYDITIAAVVVDENGIIVDCIIDSVAPTVKFGKDGVIDTATVAAVLSKNEQGEAYGMKAAGSKYEWNEQAAALCEYAIGKTVEQLKSGAINESGKAADADLASKASIYIGGYVNAIEEAAKNAAVSGAKPGDKLSLAVSAAYSKANSADAENSGLVQLDCDVAAVTLNGDVITSCIIDSLQAKVSFDASGVLAEMGPMLTKGQLGEAYGMKKAGSAYEWNEQVAYFCEYVAGKTVEQVMNIAVNEKTAPTDADIGSTVTIAVGGFQALIQKAADAVPAAGPMLGLAVLGNASKSTDASAEAAGQIKYDITVAAVLVDANGVILDCVIDSIAPTVKFDSNGVIDVSTVAEVMSKNDLGEAYGMKAAGSKYEWNEQAAALCEYAIGKTVEELKNGAVNESGKAADADLASKASIYIAGYVGAIEEAVKNACVSGAGIGDELRLAVSCAFGSAENASPEQNGLVQLDCDVAAITLNGDFVTSCIIDSLQAKVSFDASGILAQMGQMLTKGQLGEAYGMKKYGSAYEWNEQVAYFCEYVTGKTVDQIMNIAVNEKTAPTDTDISSTVTIAIGGFRDLIQKAAQ